MVVQIYEDQHIRIFHSPGTSPFRIGSFAHLGFPSDRSTYWGQSRFEKLGIECVGFVAKTNNFFPASAIQDAAQTVASLSSKPLILYGHSMGAYAALKYSKLFEAVGVIASCPMTTIDPHDVPDDRRYHQFFDPVLNADMAIKPSDVGGRLAIIYDRFERLDRYHVERLRAALPDAPIQEIHADFFGHEAVQVMIDLFVFASLIGQNFHGLSLSGLSNHIRRSKKENPKYLINLAKHVFDRTNGSPARRERTLRAVLGRIEAMPKAKVEWFVEVEMAQMLAQLEAERGRLGLAIDLLKRALAVEEAVTGSRNPNRRLALADLWSRFDCPVQSTELLTELVQEGKCQPDAGRRLMAQKALQVA